MVPNKDWMNLTNDRTSEAYINGVKEFLDYAFSRAEGASEIRCPCVKCGNGRAKTFDEVRTHLFVHGISRGYTFWYHHGEQLGEMQLGEGEEELEEHSRDELEEAIKDLHPEMHEIHMEYDNIGGENDGIFAEEPNKEANKFYKLLRDCQLPLYEGCKISKLSTIVKLLHIKTLGGWSNESFSMLLELLKNEVLPRESNLPSSYYEAKKIIKDLGLSYEKIDACPNDCMLYWKDDIDIENCKICGVSRWRCDKHNGETKIKKNGKQIPAKTLRYFPLKPRLQRLFMSSKTASNMRWHHEERVDDGILRHPADGMAWKTFDNDFKSFSLEPRNVRLGLASDGFQPFSNSKSPYSIWPVLLIPYNMPPWICMKQSNFILSMLIPGPESLGDAIDVYLQPLIEELIMIWDNGVETFDASNKQNFNLRAALLWTINDFPAYGNLSGWSTKGKMACPCCNKDTAWMRLPNSSKQCYMRHRRYLPMHHRWRNDSSAFDGTKERGFPPKPLSGYDILDQLKGLEGVILTKDARTKIKASHSSRGDNWNKKSIFFELPYWKSLLLRHNLDVMHIEKNICDNIVATIMNIKGKTKDTLNSRLDLQELKIRPKLHPIEKGINGKLGIPRAEYVLYDEAKHKFCQFLKQLKVPDGFSSNISQCVNLKELKLSGLKSHDCHVLLQRLLPLAIRGNLPKFVCEPIIELSQFFSILGSKTLKIEELDQLEALIPITLCKLERIFPPSFFDIMVHLPIHLAHEAKIGGPVHYRWMYNVERMLYLFKSFIRNRACPEGSIAEGYIANECMTLCSRYLHGIETKFNRLERNHDGDDRIDKEDLSIFSHPGRSLGAGVTQDIESDRLDKAHIYILRNCEEVQPYHKEYVQKQSNVLLVSEGEFDKSFLDWFKIKVAEMYEEDKSDFMEGLLALSRGPTPYVTSFSGFVINGYKFHTVDHSKGLRTQNCGVVVLGNIDGGEQIDYYGVLLNVIEVAYLGGRRVPLFHCNWFDVHDKVKGIKEDEYGFVSINSQHFLKIDDPFILASQASQVFYANDNLNKGWHIVIKTQPRDLFQLGSEKNKEYNLDQHFEAYQEDESYNQTLPTSRCLDFDDHINLQKENSKLEMVDVPTTRKKRKRKE